jgi:threonylcarbamoyladenosine tRNA methylthiotransferase MtaB
VPMSGFSIRFLGCKVSHTDAHEIREALLGDGHIEGGTDVAVVNTCCVTHEAVRKSRQAASRAAACRPTRASIVSGPS